MNIGRAIERVGHINGRLKSLREFVALEKHKGSAVKIESGTWKVDITAMLSADDRLALINREVERITAERNKLQSVIDMANAALKGLEL